MLAKDPGANDQTTVAKKPTALATSYGIAFPIFVFQEMDQMDISDCDDNQARFPATARFTTRTCHPCSDWFPQLSVFHAGGWEWWGLPGRRASFPPFLVHMKFVFAWGQNPLKTPGDHDTGSEEYVCFRHNSRLAVHAPPSMVFREESREPCRGTVAGECERPTIRAWGAWLILVWLNGKLIKVLRNYARTGSMRNSFLVNIWYHCNIIPRCRGDEYILFQKASSTYAYI